jgi:hypothetical protein
VLEPFNVNPAYKAPFQSYRTQGNRGFPQAIGIEMNPPHKWLSFQRVKSPSQRIGHDLERNTMMTLPKDLG